MTHHPAFLTMDECLRLSEGYLVTINMQHIYEARRSAAAAAALFGDAGARHCLDGRGAASLFERVSRTSLPLVQGNVLLDRWLRQAGVGRLLVIGSNAIVVNRVMARYPQIKTVIDERIVAIESPGDAQTMAGALAAAHPGPWTMVAIALGVPKQEMLAQALQHYLNAPIYCLGGSFEILAQAFPRSPRLIQAIGMEGVWRLMIEPSRKRVKRLALSYGNFFALRLRPPSLARLIGRSG